MRRFGRLFYLMLFSGFFVVRAVLVWVKLDWQKRGLILLAEGLVSPFIIGPLIMAIPEVIRLRRSHGYARGGLRAKHHYKVDLIGDADLILEPVVVRGRYLISVTCRHSESTTAHEQDGHQIELTQSSVSGTGMENTFEMWREDADTRSYTLRTRAIYDSSLGRAPEPQEICLSLRIYGRGEVLALPERVTVEDIARAFPVVTRSSAG